MYLKFKMGITENISQDGLIVCVLLGLFALIGLVDNFLVFRTLFRFPRARIGLFAMAGGLAIADVLYLILGVPIGIIYQLNKYELFELTQPYCKIEGYLAHSFGYITSYHLVVFAVLRAIVLTSRSRRGPTFKQGLCCSLIVWVIALIANIPMFTAFDNNGEPLCVMRFEYRMEQFLLLTLGFSFVLPLVMIILIYFATYLVCRRFCQDSFSAHQIQFSRLVTTVIFLFVVCWLPVNVLHMVILYKSNVLSELEPELTDTELDSWDYDIDKLYVVRDYFIGIAHLDKFIRPIIYATKSKDFSKCFDEIINCKLCFKDEESAGSSSSTTPLAGPTDTTPCEEIL